MSKKSDARNDAIAALELQYDWDYGALEQQQQLAVNSLLSRSFDSGDTTENTVLLLAGALELSPAGTSELAGLRDAFGLPPLPGVEDQTGGQTQSDFEAQLAESQRIANAKAALGPAADFITQEGFESLGLTGDLATDAFLRQFFGAPQGRTGPSAETLAIQQGQLDVSQQNADTAQFGAMAQDAFNRARIAIDNGQLDLAREEFEAGELWQNFAARLASRGQATSEAQTGISGFNALEAAVQGRGALELGASGQLGTLFGTFGDLLATQQRLGLDILSTPRNALPAFLMGLGDQPGFEAFDVQNILGLDPAQLQDILQRTLSGIESVQTRAQQPNEIDVMQILANISGTADQLTQGLPALGQRTTPDAEVAGMTRPPVEVAPVTMPGAQPAAAPVAPVTVNVNTAPAPAPAPVPTRSIEDTINDLGAPRGRFTPVPQPSRITGLVEAEGFEGPV